MCYASPLRYRPASWEERAFSLQSYRSAVQLWPIPEKEAQCLGLEDLAHVLTQELTTRVYVLVVGMETRFTGTLNKAIAMYRALEAVIKVMGEDSISTIIMAVPGPVEKLCSVITGVIPTVVFEYQFGDKVGVQCSHTRRCVTADYLILYRPGLKRMHLRSSWFTS